MRTVLIAATAGALTLAGVGAAQASDDVTVMTRNVFLGADLGPALKATDTASFIKAAGEIFRQLETTNFPKRAKGLAEEVQERKPDLIGLQEAALWRQGPVNLEAITGKPAATKVYQDFLKILLNRINKGKAQYEVVKVQKEFDFEAPADVDDNPKTGLFGADADFRLTMRDVILKRKGAGITTKDLRGGNYRKKNSFTVSIGPVTVTSIRGWLSARVQKKNGPWFTFANTHLEAFDDRTEVPSIRAKQAKEFAKAMAEAKGPLIAVGDFNSRLPGAGARRRAGVRGADGGRLQGHRHDDSVELLHLRLRRPQDRWLHRRLRSPSGSDLHHDPEEGQEAQDLGRGPRAVVRLLALRPRGSGRQVPREVT